MNKIQNEGQWVDISAQLNSNFEQIETDIIALQQTSWANKGYYYTEEDLLSTHPTSNVGDRAFVGSFYPYVIYLYTADGWIDTGETGDAAELQLKSHVDKHEQQLSNLETQLRIESDGNSETIADIHSNLETLNTTANKQLTLSVLDNGNIVLSNANGERKEFMPATPSGDPMHYAYVNAGAEYNDTGADITRIGVFGDAITWKAGYWWLNELGDISNEEIKYIYMYRYTAPSSGQVKSYFRAFRKTRTQMIDVPARASAIDASYFAYSTIFETIALTQKQDLVLVGNMDSFISWSQGVKKIINGLDLTYIKSESSIKEAFNNTNYLEEVRLYNLQVSVSFEKSKNLSNASIICMIENETAGKTITITLHADAYARAMADASIVEALAAHTTVTLASA